MAEKRSLSAPFLSRWPPKVTITDSHSFTDKRSWKEKMPISTRDYSQDLINLSMFPAAAT